MRREVNVWLAYNFTRSTSSSSTSSKAKKLLNWGTFQKINGFRLLFTATHEHNFSLVKYDQWLKNRRVRGTGVPFSEIDVLLCNKPTPDEIIATLPTIPRERESNYFYCFH